MGTAIVENIPYKQCISYCREERWKTKGTMNHRICNKNVQCTVVEPRIERSFLAPDNNLPKTWKASRSPLLHCASIALV